MLQATPRNWFSRTYALTRGDRRLATLELGRFREAGSLEIDGEPYEFSRAPGWGEFVLSHGGGEVCRAKKPTVFRRRFELTYGGEIFQLTCRGFLGPRYDLEHGGSVIGQISRYSLFSRDVTVDLPQRLPVEIQAFLTWLVLLMMRRKKRHGA